MPALSRRALFWTPRAVCIAFAIFLSLFALDVFDERLSLWETVVALAIHLIPTFTVLAILMLAWRWAWIGALGFVAAGGFYAKIAWGHPSWIATISGPLFLIAGLFLASWLTRPTLCKAS